ncbi:unnamed protein product, partial [Nesidiocoris tenuis]
MGGLWKWQPLRTRCLWRAKRQARRSADGREPLWRVDPRQCAQQPQVFSLCGT